MGTSSHPRVSLFSLGFLAGVAISSIGYYLLVKRRRSGELREDELSLVNDLLLRESTSENKSITPTPCIYLDYNGTTPIYPQVLSAMLPYLVTHFGNPGSGHCYGRIAKAAVDKARRQILTHLLKVEPIEETYLESIWFTSCGTESDNMAIQLALQSTKHIFDNDTLKGRPHIVTSNVEHPAVEAYLQVLEKEEGKIDVTYVPVHSDGRVRVEDVIAAIRPATTVLVTIMLANNETGAVQPVAPIAKHCRGLGILFHTDAAQAAGKISVGIEQLGQPDLISLVGHKMGAPKGIACLYVRLGCLSEMERKLTHNHGILLIGGGQEYGRRGGTENVASIVAMGEASELASGGERLHHNMVHMEAMRHRLLHNLTHALGDDYIQVHGPSDPRDRLPNTLSIAFRDIDSRALLLNVSDRVAASAGATCHSSGGDGTGIGYSAVLHAMKIPAEWAKGTIRLSLGPTVTSEQIDSAAEILVSEVKKHKERKSKRT